MKSQAKRKRFLALLKSRYGYTNEQAVDEMGRILKQFDATNKSLGILPIQRSLKVPASEELEKRK